MAPHPQCQPKSPLHHHSSPSAALGDGGEHAEDGTQKRWVAGVGGPCLQARKPARGPAQVRGGALARPTPAVAAHVTPGESCPGDFTRRLGSSRHGYAAAPSASPNPLRPFPDPLLSRPGPRPAPSSAPRDGQEGGREGGGGAGAVTPSSPLRTTLALASSCLSAPVPPALPADPPGRSVGSPSLRSQRPQKGGQLERAQARAPGSSSGRSPAN